jgi:hypothetical protein
MVRVLMVFLWRRKMSDLRSAAQQALEALEFMADEWGFTQKANRPERWQAIDALRAALKQPQRTLTDEVIGDLWYASGGFPHQFARAVERYLNGEE